MPTTEQAAIVVDVSDEAVVQQQQAAAALAQQQQAAADLAARQAAQDQAPTAVSPADVSALTDVVSSDWAAGAPAVDNAAVQEALDALDEASRENSVQIQADAITAQQDQADQAQQAIDAAANAVAQQQDEIVLAAVNSGVQIAYGSLSTPITGDPALRQPGRVEIVA